MKIIKIIIINLTILVFLVEIVSFLLINFTYLPNGLHTGAVLRADEKFSVWHPKNFNIKLATKCWESKVQFNDIGLKQSNNIGIKTKKRIAILGDSMTENLQLPNDKDLRFKLQNLLPEYEIINFSVASTGLADQIEIYNNLISKFEIDYLFLYVTENDIGDNYIDKYRPNRIAYKIENGKIVKLKKNTEFFKSYNSEYNKFKREELMTIKKFSSFYKLFAYFKYSILPNLNYKKNEGNKNNNFENKINVYKFILNKAEKEVFNKVKTLIFFNLSNNENYEKRSERANIMINILDKYNFFHNPFDESVNFMKNKNKYFFPYLGHVCDGHYSELGVEFLANYSYKIFNSMHKN